MRVPSFSTAVRRAFASFNPRTIYTSSADSKQTPTRTVKPFGELPSAYILSDGKIVEPLNEWWGGPDRASKTSVAPDLANTNVSPGNRKRVAKGSPPAKPSPTSESIESPAQSLSSGSNGLSNSNRVDGTCPISLRLKKCPAPDEVKPKRTRKKIPNASIHKPLTDSGPHNDDARMLAKPKRTKRIKPNGCTSEEATTKARVSDSNGLPQTILAQEILKNLQKFPHCLLLTRVGQFYESYFDQAHEIAHLLNIKLTTRKWGGGRIPMCGFRLTHLDKHLKVLVQQHKRFVAMCEEFPLCSENGKTFERRVTRIITPGTLIDEPFLNPFENNYLLAISISDLSLSTTTTPIGLAWIDISTGEFFSKGATLESLRDELTRIAPKEVVLHDRLKATKQHPIFEALAEDDNFVSYVSLPPPPEVPSRVGHVDSDDLSAPKHSQPIMGIGSPNNVVEQANSRDVHLKPEETLATCLITAYLHANLLEHMPSLSSPNHEHAEERMQIDSHTIKALEIREGFREGSVKGSLFSTIKRTVTSGGSRLLSRWLCSPSASIDEITARQSLVAFFHARPHFQADLMGTLSEAEDTSRIVQRFSLRRGDTSDLLSVKRTTHVWNKIVKRIQHEKNIEMIERAHFDAEDWTSLDALVSRMVELNDLSKNISAALEDRSMSIDEETPEQPNETSLVDGRETSMESNGTWRYGPAKWTIKPGFSPTLLALHRSLHNLLSEREELERYLQLIYDAPSLTLRVSPSHGMHVHLAKAKRDQKSLNASAQFISIAESGTTQCYFYKEWSRLGSQIVETTLALTTAEKEAFETLRTEVNSHAQSLRRNARILHELDVALSFAKLASELNFVRPKITNEAVYMVKNGRHPTVEIGLLEAGRIFTPNSLTLSSSSRLHVITGPNMAGKSTFLRQTALIAILAQTGSFVPADSATIGIVDKLFSRIGAKDDLFHDRSTFMVEMLETAEILRKATPRSLVIMDEVGRGTTVTDGLAIAFASLHHLVITNKCRTLFATHFHELSDLLGYPNLSGGVFEDIDFFCTDVDEMDDDHFAYQYHIRPGINRNSHGLKVAQLAGMPPAAIALARDTLSQLKARQANMDIRPII